MRGCYKNYQKDPSIPARIAIAGEHEEDTRLILPSRVFPAFALAVLPEVLRTSVAGGRKESYFWFSASLSESPPHS